MRDITSAIDLTAAIRACKPYVDSLSPGLAAMNAAAFSALAVVFGMLAWYFDFDSTLTFLDPFALELANTLPLSLAALVPLFGFLLTVSPTITELFLPAIARVKLVAVLLYAVVIFDALTDYPRVETFLLFYEPSSDWIEYALWQAAHAVGLLFATLGFEFLFALCAVTTLMCVVRAFTGSVVRGA